MTRIHIKTPIWYGRRVGIASHIHDDIEVAIGHESYPHKYRMRWGKLQHYPVHKEFSKGVPVRTPAIADFEVHEVNEVHEVEEVQDAQISRRVRDDGEPRESTA